MHREKEIGIEWLQGGRNEKLVDLKNICNASCLSKDSSSGKYKNFNKIILVSLHVVYNFWKYYTRVEKLYWAISRINKSKDFTDILQYNYYYYSLFS